MEFQKSFMRRELKYLITNEQRDIIKEAITHLTVGDKYGKSTIRNVYFDTPTRLLIRRSLEKPVYKEKLRVRTYDSSCEDPTVFLEIKKKYNDVVFKRRAYMSLNEQEAYLSGVSKPDINDQMIKEIDYFFEYYQNLQPSVYLSYEREAFFGIDDSDFRITFDNNILWRDTDLSLRYGVYGEPLIDDGICLMELKLTDRIPLWMAEVLSSVKAYRTSFSKYGRAYLTMLSRGHTCFNLKPIQGE